MNDFKNREFELRKKESNAVFHKYPKSLPIIIYAKYNDTPKLKKHKYIVPNNLSCSHLFDIIRKQLDMSKDKALFFFTDDNKLISYDKAHLTFNGAIEYGKILFTNSKFLTYIGDKP